MHLRLTMPAELAAAVLPLPFQSLPATRLHDRAVCGRRRRCDLGQATPRSYTSEGESAHVSGAKWRN